MSCVNPLRSVRETCGEVVSLSKHVSLIESAIETHATKLCESVIGDFTRDVEWDAHGWHYSADVQSKGPLTVQFIFVMDALNFCFWPSPGFEYDTLAVALKKVLEHDEHAFDADRLACISEVYCNSIASTYLYCCIIDMISLSILSIYACAN